MAMNKNEAMCKRGCVFCPNNLEELRGAKSKLKPWMGGSAKFININIVGENRQDPETNKTIKGAAFSIGYMSDCAICYLTEDKIFSLPYEAGRVDLSEEK